MGAAAKTDRLADRLHSVVIQLLRHARAEDAASGLSATRLSVLSVLVYGGDRTVTELATAEQVATPTMTRMLQGMEEAGHVVRRRDAADRRVQRISVTARGRRALDSARQARLRRLSKLLRRMPAADRPVLESVLDALESALER
jgi:DNA-binding MarR family transcriptional regulator